MIGGQGAPLKFLLALVGGWVSLRAFLLWPTAAVATAPALLPAPLAGVGAAVIEVSAPAVALPDRPAAVFISLPPRRTARVVYYMAPRRRDGRSSRQGRTFADGPESDAAEEQSALLTLAANGAVDLRAPQQRRTLAGQATLQPVLPTSARRLSASTWMLARPAGGAASLAGGAGQLGGAQMGMRLAYRIAGTPAAPVSLVSRFSSPLATSGRELAFGVEAQPFRRVPIRLVAERRIALERGAANGFAFSALGGGSWELPGAFRLDGYGQAGFVGLKRRAGFVDGAAVASREMFALGDMRVRAGAGLWGGAQPGVSRVDIGPHIEMGVPLAGRTWRVGFDWRQRIAGNATPGSGPALTLGTDF